MRHKRRSILQVSQNLSLVVLIICCRVAETGVSMEKITATRLFRAKWQLT
jgi:hypothetical protein